MTRRSIKRTFYFVFCIVLPIGVFFNFKTIWIYLFYQDLPAELAYEALDTQQNYLLQGGGLTVGSLFFGVMIAEILTIIVSKIAFGKREKLLRNKVNQLKREGHQLYVLTTHPLTVDESRFMHRAASINRSVVLVLSSISFVISILFLIFSGFVPFFITFVLATLSVVGAKPITNTLNKLWNTMEKVREKQCIRGIITEKWGGEGETYIALSGYTFRVSYKDYDNLEVGDVVEIEFVRTHLVNIILNLQKINEGIPAT